MNKKTPLSFLLILSLLLIASTTGCLGPKESVEEIKYPNSSEINIPEEVSDDLKSEIPSDSALTAYSSEDSAQEVSEWFTTELSERRYQKTQEINEYNTTVWEKQGNYLAIMILEEEKAKETMDISDTVIIQIST